MAKTKISEFSATPGNNTDIDGINIAEGCAPSGINDAIRELMAQLKDFQAGTAGDSFNGPVGTTTAAAGAFTTLSSTGNTTLGDAAGDTVTVNGTATFANANPTLSAGTANGVAYLNGSKVLTTGSALTFDGTNLGIGTSSPVSAGSYRTTTINGTSGGIVYLQTNGTTTAQFSSDASSTFLTSSTALPLLFGTNAAERMRIDSSGNLTLNTTNARSSRFSVEQTGTSTKLATFSNAVDSDFEIKSTASSVMTIGPSTGALAIQAAGTERMRIDSSGNVGIGTSSIQGKFNVASGRSFFGANSETYSVAVGFTQSRVASGQVYYIGATDSATPDLVFSSAAGTERARINSSGDFLVATTDSALTTGNGIKFLGSATGKNVVINSSASTNANEGYMMYSTGAGAYRFYVQWDGKINATSTTIAAISDERLKENIRDLDLGLTDILALKPRRYDWKEGKGPNIKDAVGFIAQEFETVFPTSVGLSKAGEDGIEYKNICHEELIPTLVKAIQEQQAIINQINAKVEAQAAEIAALKGQA